MNQNTSERNNVLERNLGLDILGVTEAAAIAASKWVGRGDKNAGDGSAVDAMRAAFNQMDFDGIVIIGEGEKDEAPMLFKGEQLGTKKGPKVDVAIDPVEGTSLLAKGRPNSIATISLAPRGAMFDPGPAFYMKKLAVPHEAAGVVELDMPVAELLKKVARALGKDVRELTVFVLEKERHAEISREIFKAGARVQSHTDGDVAGALLAVMPHTGVDLMLGTGGTPEGVLAATAVKVLGGQILGRLDPQSDEEKADVLKAGLSLTKVLGVDDLVKSDDVYFAATGITTGFLKGVTVDDHKVSTHSVLMHRKLGSVRYVDAVYNLHRL
ncbi:MAG: class II fructose-bisphosphatase [Deltaproteobacteria bacterium]|nr:class II fructose-bisphosphatase [Deltaproteobacteria bacterium]